MAQTAQQLTQVMGASVKKYYEPIADAAEKLAEAKNYTDQQVSANNTPIIDNLTSSDATKPLSAHQGKVLKGFVDELNDLVASDDTSLDTVQEIVAYIKANKSTLDGFGIAAITGLQAELNSKEASFSKNTAFNKNFGNSAGTIAEGNDPRILNAVTGTITVAQSDAAFNPA